MQNNRNADAESLAKIKKIAEELARVQTMYGVIAQYQKVQELYEGVLYLKMKSEEELRNRGEALLKEEAPKPEIHQVTEIMPEETPKQEEIREDVPVEAVKLAEPEVKPKEGHKAKFSLAAIKGLKGEKQEEIEEEPEPIVMVEDAPAKKEIKFTVEDKQVFTEKLFDNDFQLFKNVMGHVQGLGSLEEANKYLSSFYRDKKWKKVDKVAQKLWALVENHFKS